MRRNPDPERFLIKNLEAVDRMAEIADLIDKTYKDLLSMENELTPLLKKNMIDGLTTKIQAFGEESTNVSNDFQQEHDVIRWGDFRKLRNIMAHNYEFVDDDIIISACENMLNIRDTLDEIVNQYK